MIAAVASLRGHNLMTCTNDPKVTNYRCRNCAEWFHAGASLAGVTLAASRSSGTVPETLMTK
jgi:hypothetical protein